MTPVLLILLNYVGQSIPVEVLVVWRAKQRHLGLKYHKHYDVTASQQSLLPQSQVWPSSDRF